jgi:hypothetical protein
MVLTKGKLRPGLKVKLQANLEVTGLTSDLR